MFAFPLIIERPLPRIVFDNVTKNSNDSPTEQSLLLVYGLQQNPFHVGAYTHL